MVRVPQTRDRDGDNQVWQVSVFCCKFFLVWVCDSCTVVSAVLWFIEFLLIINQTAGVFPPNKTTHQILVIFVKISINADKNSSNSKPNQSVGVKKIALNNIFARNHYLKPLTKFLRLWVTFCLDNLIILFGKPRFVFFGPPVCQ